MNFLSMLLPAIFGGAASAATGGPRETKSSYDRTNTDNSSGYTQRILLPEQQDAIAQFSPFVKQLMSDPSAGLEPMRRTAMGRVNNNFVGAPQLVRNKFSTGGGNRSGRTGRAGIDLEMGRLGQLAGVNSQYDQMASDRQMQGASLIQQFLGQNFGTSTSATSTSHQIGTGTNVESQPGGMFGQGLGGALGTLAALMSLSYMRGGGSNPSTNEWEG
jgi:hypothetical protein